MTSHLGLMVLFAALVSPAFAALHRDDWASGVQFTWRLFGSLVGGAVLMSWGLYLVFG
ncbi:MAG: hypothetical protein HQ485_06215 [Acidobacteria bacterium]|jgi:hypothetical protein|nr:hypothetical protein [Acidobacteriota bacterium]